MRRLLILLIPFVFCSCTQTMTSSLHQNITPDLKALGVEDTVINADLEEIAYDINDILHQNFSLDDTFYINGNASQGFYGKLIPIMRQSGFKVLLTEPVNTENMLHINYSFTVTNHQLIETADVALFRMWVGEEFQLSKAFTQTPDGLKNKTAYCVLGGNSNG